MGDDTQFKLVPLPQMLLLNGGLKDKVRFQERTAVSDIRETVYFNSDLDGDGIMDEFTLEIKDNAQVDFQNSGKNKFTLFLPGGKDAIKRIIPGDDKADRDADFLLEMKDGSAWLIENLARDGVQEKAGDHAKYISHLKNVRQLLSRGDQDEALLSSVMYNFGMVHTWVLPEETVNNSGLFTWLDGKPAYTDCFYEFFRVCAELFNKSGTFSEFEQKYIGAQYYEVGSGEHTDFFTYEALPRLIKLGYVTDLTDEILKDAPRVTGVIDKKAWYELKPEQLRSGNDLPKWNYSLSYIPFSEILELKGGKIAVKPEYVSKLSTVSALVIMCNENRKVTKKVGGEDVFVTNIPDMHIAWLVKIGNEIKIVHSTPTSDVGIPFTGMENLDNFFRARFVTIDKDGKIQNKNPAVVGLKVLKIN